MIVRLVVAFLSTAAGRAAVSTAWEITSYQDFLRGRFTGVALSRDGRVHLAPKIEPVFASGQPVIWSAVRSADGTLYLGTGHRGRVFRVDPAGRAEVLWTAEQPEIFAVALDSRGRLYAAASPGGRIYRIEAGKAAEFFVPEAGYIWSLEFGKDGALYAGAGDPGRIYRIDSSGRGEVWYETGQSHVTSLAFDAQGRLLAGTEPNGILYRIAGKGKAFVLYDSPFPEIRAIAPSPDGSVYAAAMGGSILRQSGSATGPAPGGTPGVVTAPTVSITVTGEAAQSGIEIKPKPEAPKPSAAPASTGVSAMPASAIEQAGVEKSALYRIRPDNSVETLWTSKDENVYDLIPSGGRIVFSTDAQGRIYELTSDRKLTLLAQTNESEVLRLVETPGALLAATGNLGKILRLGSGAADSGVYESPVHDAGGAARWGRLSWRADSCPRCTLAFRTRTGNSARPDDTWSDWSEPLVDASGAAVTSPNARYVQWKAELAGAAGVSPALDSVRLSYLPQNYPPVVRSLTVTAQTAPAGQPKTAAAAALPVYSITVTDTGETAASSLSGTPTQPVGRASIEQLVISWQAEDTDGDRLAFTLSFRGENERRWIDLRTDAGDSSYTIDAEALADGRYFFRVVASDRSSNPEGAARDAELISAPILVDHTPPAVTVARAGPDIEIEAADAASPLRNCEYSIDAGPWSALEAVDGVTDSLRERFRLRLPALAPGEHLLVVRVLDLAGNPGLSKLVLGQPLP